MTYKFIPALFALTLLGSNVAQARPTMTFAEWIAACSPVSETAAYSAEAGECLGYTKGVLDAARLTEPDEQQLFCDPRESVTARDYIELGQKWAAENAAGLESSAAFQLMQAFIFYMPCDEGAAQADAQ